MSAQPLEQFRDAIHAAGLHSPEFITADGRLHRFPSNGTRDDDSGWYVFHTGDIPAGAFGCWRGGFSKTWRADIGRALTPEETAAQKARMQETQRTRKAEEIKLKAKAREKAAAIWRAAGTAPEDHPYLAKKGVKAHGLRARDGELVIPVRDSGGVLHSLQTIAADGKKNFLFGGHVTGCFFMLGEPDGTLCIAEGFATGASVFECTGFAVAVAFNSGNLLPVVRALRPKFHDMRLIVCADDDIKTFGNPGMRDGRKAAQAVGASLATPDFGSNRPEDVSDFNDLHQCAGLDAVRACIEKAAQFNGLEAGVAAESEPCEIDREIARLAKLRAVDYERERKDAAAKLNVRKFLLDKLVSAARPPDDSAPGQGRSLKLDAPEPWPEPVHGAALLSALAGAIRHYVVLSKEDADAAALWCVHTYAFDAFPCTPRLAITSPTPRCGKTTLLDVIETLVARPLQTANISAAAVFRTVEIARLLY